jgi:hypothetical protein
MFWKIAALALFNSVCAAACLPFQQAPKHIGDTACVTGTVINVGISAKSGTHFLNFCEDHHNCPFTVVIFASDLARIGDVRWLEGKTIEIYGNIKEFKGATEIILSSLTQLRGAAGKLPPLPKQYDVSSHGSYSPGKFKSARAHSKKKNRRSARSADDAAGEADSSAPPDH